LSPAPAAPPLVVCVGIAVLDRVYRVARLPDGAGKRFASAFAEVGGGPAATAAVTVARLGGRADLWARVGDDTAGAAIAADLSAHGVGTETLRRVPGAVSVQSAVAVDEDGERAILSYRDPALAADASWLPLDRARGAGAVLADVRWPEGAEAALRAARGAGVPTVLDADATDDDALGRLVPLADHAVFSAPGLERFAGTADPAAGLAKAAAANGGVAAVTAGEHGCWWRGRDGTVRRVPAFRVRAVDTLGAGDVFHGAYALAVAEGADAPRALSFASAAAALKCARHGGRSAIPGRAETERFLEEHG
jgi:sulfofructose kinase